MRLQCLYRPAEHALFNEVADCSERKRLTRLAEETEYVLAGMLPCSLETSYYSHNRFSRFVLCIPQVRYIPHPKNKGNDPAQSGRYATHEKTAHVDAGCGGRRNLLGICLGPSAGRRRSGGGSGCCR
jgi:hypothetical protein